MSKTDFRGREKPAIRALDLAELEAVGGGDGCNLDLEGAITWKEFIKNNFGVKWPIPD